MTRTCNVTGLTKKLEKWVESECTCIVDQGYHRWEIVVDQSSKSKDIYMMVNPLLMGYDTENGITLQKLLYQRNHQFQDKGRKNCCWNLREWSKKPKTFQKLLE